MPEFNYKFDDLLNPCLQAFHKLGGSGSNNEIEEQVIKILELTDDEVNDPHGRSTRLNYRLRWARNYLKNYGLLENSARGVWSLTEEGYKTETVDQKEVVDHVRALHAQVAPEEDGEPEVPVIDQIGWKEELLDLLKRIEPSAFERLSQRLLRELGFNNVEVTGRPGDGGIDGKGNLSIGSVITFRVVFQCKRYRDSVSSEAIRQFRGAVEGRADKGLIITTGKFTRNAREEAQRDGALAIDLLDGDELAEKLKDLQLGVNVSLVENVSIDAEWFDRF